MRILHTSDWHLGRSFHGFSLLDDQASVLETLVTTVQEEQVDLVVVAGDLYDRAVPPADAISLCDELLGRLRATGARVVAVAGNHDSGPRLGFGEAVMTAGGVTIRGDVRRVADPVTLDADDGGAPVACFLVPYLEPELARHALGAPEARTHDAIWGAAGAAIEARRRALGPHRSILVAHAFLAGGAATDSERVLSVGGVDQVEPGALGGFDYVALGHLHRAQTIGRGRMRYSGSPVAYSFSEAADTKQAWLVDLAPDGSVGVEPVVLPVPRALATVRGTLEELLADPALAAVERAWIRAELTDPVPPKDPRERLRARFAHIAHLVLDPPARTADGTVTTYRERGAGRTDLELATAFLAEAAGIDVDASALDDLSRAFDAAALQEISR